MSASSVTAPAAAPGRPSGRPDAGQSPVLRRAAFMAPAVLALLAGLDAALMLIGLPAPVRADRLPEVHGMLLVLGFVGTLIALERAVALRRALGFLAPGLLGLGGLLLVTAVPLPAGKALLTAGAAALIGVYAALWRRQRAEAVLVQALGAVAATGAALLWLGGVPVPLLLPWLVGFVVLTIGGERLELARIDMGPTAGRTLLLLSGALLTALVAALLWPRPGAPLFGLALLALGGWLAAHDAARRTIRGSGAARFAAGCMLAGYAWLGIAAATWLLGGAVTGGPRYDVVIHSVFLGFTISMIMAHAPTILPAVLRRPLPYSPLLIAPAVLLHASLALRLWIGDGYGFHAAWQGGGVLNIAALLLFLAVAGWSAAAPRSRGRRQ